MTERLQRILAEAGITSRRKAEDLIAAGRVQVNGAVAHVGQSADPSTDTILVDGQALPKQDRIYFLLNKPPGYTTSLADRHAQHLVTELLPPNGRRVFPVGRLDRDSSGLLLLTNDGWLAHRLMHPRYRIPKVYEAWVEGRPGRTHIERLIDGIVLDEGPARAEAVRVIKVQGGNSLVRITLKEGKKREVRRMFMLLGHPVLELTRVEYAGLTIDGLEEGRARPLQLREVRALYDLVRNERLPHRPRFGEERTRDRDRKPSSSPNSGRRAGVEAPRARHSIREPQRNNHRTYR